MNKGYISSLYRLIVDADEDGFFWLTAFAASSVLLVSASFFLSLLAGIGDGITGSLDVDAKELDAWDKDE